MSASISLGCRITIEPPYSDSGYIDMHTALFQHPHALIADYRRLSLAVLVRFLVTYKQFSLLTVALRFVLRYFDDRENAVAFPEDAIHLFQGTISGLGIEEPDTREDGGITIIGA